MYFRFSKQKTVWISEPFNPLVLCSSEVLVHHHHCFPDTLVIHTVVNDLSNWETGVCNRICKNWTPSRVKMEAPRVFGLTPVHHFLLYTSDSSSCVVLKTSAHINLKLLLHYVEDRSVRRCCQNHRYLCSGLWWAGLAFVKGIFFYWLRYLQHGWNFIY